MASLRRPGLDLHYEDRGAGAPDPGDPRQPERGRVLGRSRARAGRERLGCITYDRRGYHRSAVAAARRSTSTTRSTDVGGLLTELDAAPAVVIGRSTGGQIALALAVRRPDLVQALVLLEPAVFSVDARARRWAGELREELLAAGDADPQSVARALFDLTLGPELWEGIPEEARGILTAGGPTVLAEINGRGLDLSTEPFTPAVDDLSAVLQPTLVLTGQTSYAVGRAVDVRLTDMLPNARHQVVDGGHLIDPAHPAVLEFLARVVAGQASVDAGA